jgi:hypothetical protein
LTACRWRNEAAAALAFSLGFAAGGRGDYASEIQAYRRANGFRVRRRPARCGRAKQAQAMASSGTITHSVGGQFSSRVAPLRKSRAAENIGAGFLAFSEMLKEWKASRGHRENLLMPGARRVGVASVANPRSPYRRFWAMVITD